MKCPKCSTEFAEELSPKDKKTGGKDKGKQKPHCPT